MRYTQIAGSLAICVMAATNAAAQQKTTGAASQPKGQPQSSAVSSDQSAKTLLTKARELAKGADTIEKYTAALKLCRQAQQVDPSPATSAYVKRLAAWIYNKRGETLIELAEEIVEKDAQRAVEYEEAGLRDFDVSSKLNPQDWRPRYNRGVSRAIVGEYEKSLEDLDFVLEQNSDHKNARYNRAEIRYQLGRYDAAIEDYDQVLRLDPQDASAYSGRGLARYQLEKYDDALLDLNAVIRLRPDDAVGYADRADVYASLGQWERAAGDYRIAIRLDNALARAYHNVAWLMATCPDKRFRKAELAIRAARKAIELDGESHRYLDTLAAAQASAGKFELARATLRKALELAPADSAAVLKERLALYESQRPYREAVPEVRLASFSKEE